LEDNYVLDIQLNLNPANFKHAQRIVTGVTLAFGVHAVNLVEMEFNLDLGMFNALQ